MRIVVVKQPVDLKSLGERLVRPGQGSTAVIEALKVLNPHVDFARLDAGTVLLVPDGPEVADGESASIGGESFASLAAEAKAAVKAAGVRLRAGLERCEAERKEVAAVLRSAAFRRLAEADAPLREQAAGAEARLKDQAKLAADSAAALEAIQKALPQALEALAKAIR